MASHAESRLRGCQCTSCNGLLSCPNSMRPLSSQRPYCWTQKMGKGNEKVQLFFSICYDVCWIAFRKGVPGQLLFNSHTEPTRLWSQLSLSSPISLQELFVLLFQVYTSSTCFPGWWSYPMLLHLGNDKHKLGTRKIMKFLKVYITRSRTTLYVRIMLISSRDRPLQRFYSQPGMSSLASLPL